MNNLKKRTQPFVIIPKDIFEATKDKSAICLYIALMSYADNNTGACFPSYSKLTKQTGMGRSTISKAIKTLIDCGMMTYEQGSKVKSNTYIIEFDTPKGSPKTEPPKKDDDLGSPKTGPEGSPKTGLEVVLKQDSNLTDLTKTQSNLTHIGGQSPKKPTTKTDLIYSKNLDKPDRTKLKKLLNEDPQFVKDWLKGKIWEFARENPNKYTQEMYEAFIFYWSSVDDISGKTNLSITYAKTKTFAIPGRLATWAKRDNSFKQSANSHLSFNERDSIKAKENLEFIKSTLGHYDHLNAFTEEEINEREISQVQHLTIEGN